MKIRKALSADLEAILTIYADARDYMRDHGNKTQWAGSYPPEALVRADIEAGELYVCTDDASTADILGVFFYKNGEDPTYERIYEGHWQNDAPYGVIHRIAVSKNSRGKGVASFCFAFGLAHCHNLRIDTHRNNEPMQKALLKNGFLPCGIIYLENGEERVAFQKSEL